MGHANYGWQNETGIQQYLNALDKFLITSAVFTLGEISI